MNRTCMTCRNRITTSHRAGLLNKCGRLGILVSPANILGETITCDFYLDRINEGGNQPGKPEGTPAYLL